MRALINFLLRLFFLYKKSSCSREDPAARGELLEWLKQRLERHPSWVEGHLEYGSRAFQSGKIAEAYAAAQAVRTLDRGRFHKDADHLLARCFLSRGEYGRSCEILRGLVAEFPGDSTLKETLAAAEIGLKNFPAAHEMLSAIPLTERNPEAHAALAWTKSKMT